MPRERKTYLRRVQNLQAKQIKTARDHGYRNIAVVNGIVCAVHPFEDSFGLVVGIDEDGYNRRYSFDKKDDALTAMATYMDPKSGHPTGPWFKCDGIFRGMPHPLLKSEMYIATPDGLVKRRQIETPERKRA